MRHYTKEEALTIINNNERLKADLAELKEDVKEYFGLNYYTDYANFFSLYNPDTKVLDKSKVVIQYVIKDNEPEEIIADSLEEAVVLLFDIENKNK